MKSNKQYSAENKHLKHLKLNDNLWEVFTLFNKILDIIDIIIITRYLETITLF